MCPRVYRHYAWMWGKLANASRIQYSETIMRPRRPQPASPDEVRISREGDSAIIECAGPRIRGVHVRCGPALATMTDEQVLERFNLMLEAQSELAANVDWTLTEIPPGRPQVEYYDRGDQWVSRAEGLRRHIASEAHRQPLICIDEVVLDMVGLGPPVRRGAKFRDAPRTGRVPAMRCPMQQ